MKLSSMLCSLLCASTALAADSPFKRDALGRTKTSFDKRQTRTALDKRQTRTALDKRQTRTALDKRQTNAPIMEKRIAYEPFKHPELQKRAARFLTDKTKEFEVNGTGIPDVPFDVGESYAGLLPISDSPDETRKLFFWFFPTIHPDTPEEIVIWLNGGPGCSSLAGFLTENGPFTWKSGTYAPVQNAYSWHNLTNMIWVEQPVGVGFSQGVPNISDEVELATQFRGFWKSFVDTFGLHGWDAYVTGESYAGFYAPYIADGFLQQNDTDYFNLAGISISNPLIGDETLQQQIVQLPFMENWNNLLYLNETFLDQFRQHNAECNFTEYYDTYFKFPAPQEPFPVPPNPWNSPTDACNQYYNFYSAAMEINPCFNIYHITETCPHAFSQLGIVNGGDYQPPGAQIYFNRTDVQKAINAAVGTNWQICTETNVFGHGNSSNSAMDASPPPASNGVLQRVIERTNNTIIGSGDLDMQLSTNGTLFAIQNMTWNGHRGLKDRPSTPLYVPYHPEYNRGSLAGAGFQGVWSHERGLTFYTAHMAGHELPSYAPGVAYRMLEVLLGRIQDFSSTESFTTQVGNFTGSGRIYKRGVMEVGILLE